MIILRFHKPVITEQNVAPRAAQYVDHITYDWFCSNVSDLLTLVMFTNIVIYGATVRVQHDVNGSSNVD